MCSSRKDLPPLSTSPPLSAAFYLLFKENPALGLTCIRPRCFSRSLFVAMSLGMPFPSAGVWAMLPLGTEEWNHRVRSGNTEGRHRNKPCLPTTSPETIQKSSCGQGEWAASVVLAAENPYGSSCPAFLPPSPFLPGSSSLSKLFGTIKMI